MGQLQLLGPGQKVNATSAEAAQAARVRPRGTWISEGCNNVVWRQFSTGGVALVLNSQKRIVVVGVRLMMLPE